MCYILYKSAFTATNIKCLEKAEIVSSESLDTLLTIDIDLVEALKILLETSTKHKLVSKSTKTLCKVCTLFFHVVKGR